MRLLILTILLPKLLFSQNIYCVKLTFGNNRVIDNVNELIIVNDNNYSPNDIMFDILDSSEDYNTVSFSFPNEFYPPTSITGYYYNPGYKDGDKDGDGIKNSDETLNEVEEYRFIDFTMGGFRSINNFEVINSSVLNSNQTSNIGEIENDFFTNFKNHSLKLIVSPKFYTDNDRLLPPIFNHCYIFFQFP